MRVKRRPVKCSECPKHCFCGSTTDMEQNHLCGKNHVPWFLYPFCKKDHAEFHVMCRRAGVDFEYTKDKSIRLVQALKAMMVGVWMVLDILEKHHRTQLENRQ